MKNKAITIFLLLVSLSFFAQTATGDIEVYLGVIIDNAPQSSGDNYTEPTPSQLNTWNTIIDLVLADNLVDARSNTNTLNYQLTEFTDTSISPNQIFYILEEKSPQSNYWGTYTISKTPTRNNLIIQAPHSKYDTNTGKQAVFCFKNTLARAVFINGTHRCNHSSFSSCSGTTSVCGSSDAYRISDLAHNTNTIFQKTTENLFNTISNSIFIQLHGFGKKATDPYVILSNGTREAPSIDYTLALKNALLIEDNTLTFKIAHIDTDWTRLIGFTNTQGRLINNSSDHCNTSTTTTSGRFIHIEQEKSKLRDDVNDWVKMSNALAATFTSTLSIDDHHTNSQITIYPNPTSGEVSLKGILIKSVEIFDSVGKQINLFNNPKNNKAMQIDLQKYTSGIYMLKIVSEKHVVVKRIIKF